MVRPTNASSPGDTRERIVRAAARLFSELGYQGASTRAITEAVGIKQPSLFHYFPGKEAIGREIVQRRVSASALLSGEFACAPDDPALDLFLLIRSETALENTLPLDTRWLFRLPPAVAGMFPEWETAIGHARGTTATIIRRGIDAGRFLPAHPEMVLEIVDAVANQAMFWPHDNLGIPPQQIAEVMLRLVITDPQVIAEVAARAGGQEQVRSLTPRSGR